MNDKFVFKEKRNTVSVYCSDIVFFESYGHYVTMHMNDGKTHSVRSTITALCEKLNEKVFLRVHRGIIVNLSYVSSVDHGGILLNPLQHKVPVSRSRRRKSEEALNEFNKAKKDF